MRNSKLSKVLALTLVFALMLSNLAFAEPAGNVISNTLEANFNVTEIPIVAVTDVSVTNATTVTMGSTLVLTATVTPENATDKTVVWTVANGTGEATIADNILTPVKAGTVTVTATAGGKSGTVEITISNEAITGSSQLSAKTGAFVDEDGCISQTDSLLAKGFTFVAGSDRLTVSGTIAVVELEALKQAMYGIDNVFAGFTVANPNKNLYTKMAYSDFFETNKLVQLDTDKNWSAAYNIFYKDVSGWTKKQNERTMSVTWGNADGSRTLTQTLIFDATDVTIDTTIDTVANVGTLDAFIAALADTTKATINITAGFETAEKILVNRAVTINGGNNTILFTGDAVGWHGNYALHVYGTTGVTINDLKMTGADGGLLVNGSAVTLTGTIDVSGNEFGGIEVSKGTAIGLSPSVLTVSGTLVNDFEEDGLPTVWLVKDQGTVTGANVPATTIEITKLDNTQQTLYYMVPASATKIVNLTWITGGGTKGATVREPETVSFTAKLAAGVLKVENTRLVIEVSKTGIVAGDFEFTEITSGTLADITLQTADGKLTFLCGPALGTTIDGNVNVSFKFNSTGAYKINIYLIQVK